jgi:murein DD-endopeptidase MepM/ murein hydrolase activator NlpD
MAESSKGNASARPLRRRGIALLVAGSTLAFPAVAAAADDPSTSIAAVAVTSAETPVGPPSADTEPWFNVRANWTATREIRFPVLGPVVYRDDWGECRDGEIASSGLSAAEVTACPRHHAGNDLFGVKLQPLLAAVDGTVTELLDEEGKAGNGITIEDVDHWTYHYFHMNNDTPGSKNDGANAWVWRYAPEIRVGATVRAGQLLGYMGDSGNAEGDRSHLHFEIHRPSGIPIDAFQSLQKARRAESCSPPRVLLGDVATQRDAFGVAVVAVDVVDATTNGSWRISSAGGVVAKGDAAIVAPGGYVTPPCKLALSWPVMFVVG